MQMRHNRFRPTLEFLEQREVPASHLQASLSNGYLYIQDSSPSDSINVSQSGGRLSVGGASISSGNTWQSSVDANSVKQVVIYSYGGGCSISLHPSDANQVTRSAYVLAYGGHNTIIDGAGNDTLYAYGGYNQIFAGNGQDYLIGYGGHNTMVGGAGYDVLYGYDGNNALYGKNGTAVLISMAVSSPDTLVGGSGYNWYYRPVYAGQPFASGEHVSDVVQGDSPLCQTDAALAMAVQQGVNFSQRITYLGNYNYRVQLYGAPAQTVTFNGYYNDTDTAVAAGSMSFWPVLMMRARLQALGISPYADYTSSQWDTMNRNLSGRLYSVSDALTMFTGRATTFYTPGQVSPQTLQADLSRGQLIVASSVYQSGTTGDGIIGNHAYAVLSVYYQNGTWKVQLYNPWGKDSTGGRTIDAQQTGSAAKDDGYITLTWAQFTSTANFHGYTVA